MEVEGVNKLLGNLNELVNSITESIKDNLVDKTLIESLEEISKIGEIEHTETLSELEQAKLLNIYSYILVSLYFTSLKLCGDKINNESPIMFEIKRVKEYMDKVKLAEDQFLKKETKEQRKERESENFIKKHIGVTGNEPAVSKTHFGSHVRFNNEEEKLIVDAKNSKDSSKKKLKNNNNSKLSSDKIDNSNSKIHKNKNKNKSKNKNKNKK